MKETNVQRTSLFVGFLVCGLGALFYCYEYLLRIEPSVMIPELMREFGVTASSLGLLTALYYYAYTPMQLVVGLLTDTFGVRLIITVAIAICTFGSLLFSTTHSIYIAGIGRFMIGLGSAFAFVAVLKLAAVWLPKKHFAFFAGFATALGMVGAMAGDVELTVLMHRIGWQHTLYIGTVIGAILIPVIWLVVRDGPKKSVIATNEVAANYKETFRGLWEIIKNPQMWLSGFIGCAMFLSLSVVAELWGIPFLKAVYHLSADNAAFACSSVFLGWLVGAPLSGWISDRGRNRRLPIIFGAIFSALVLSVIIYHPVNFTLIHLSILLFLFGLFSSAEVICFAIARENNPTHVAATAIAFTNLLVMVGGVVLQPLVGRLLDIGWRGATLNGVRVYTASDYQHAFWIIPICIIVAAVLTVILRESYGHEGEWDEFD
ncbi:MAG: MFS transporter [Gammaproteobacteria bacterium]|nr:MFS transporter [Gammaproteobacteria bacterium]